MSDAVSLQEVMDNAGLTNQQKESQIAKKLLGVASSTSISEVETLNGLVGQSEKRLGVMRDSIYSLNHQLADLQQRIDQQSQFIADGPTKDGLLAYKAMLESTRDVFGEEKMSEEVICKAIEAASYGMWRTVMGPKDAKNDSRKNRTDTLYL